MDYRKYNKYSFREKISLIIEKLDDLIAALGA